MLRVLRGLAARVLVAHPGQQRLIFRSKDKNDRNDAERLAKLLYREWVSQILPPAKAHGTTEESETVALGRWPSPRPWLLAAGADGAGLLRGARPHW